MSYLEKEFPVLRVSSLKELLDHEKEIVRRIGAVHSGGHLLMLDPQRLLRELYVELTPHAARETQKHYPEFFATTGGESAYDRVSKSTAAGDVRVTVHGLFRKVAV